MAIRARASSKADTAATSHVVALPVTTQAGDRVVVAFTNDTEDSAASTATAGWSLLGTVAQGTTTNHRCSIFTRVGPGDLTVDLSISEEATWIVIVFEGDGGTPTVASGSGGAPGSPPTIADITSISSLDSGTTYDSVVFCAIDASTDSDFDIVATPPTNWINTVTQRAGVTSSAHTYSADRSLTGVTVIAPGSWSVDEAEQWVTWHVVVPHVESAPGGGGTTPVVRSASGASGSAGSDPAVVPKPAGLAVGDLMIAVHVGDNDGSLANMTGPSGWTTIASQAATPGGQPAVKVWQMIATSTEVAASNFTFNVGAGGIFCSAGIIAITTGTFDPADPIGAGPSFTINASNSTSHVAPSLTGIVNGLLITGHSVDQGGAATCSYTPPSGMTERVDTAASPGWTCLEMNTLELTSTAATGTKTATCTQSRPATSVSMIVNPAPSDATRRTAGFLTLLAA